MKRKPRVYNFIRRIKGFASDYVATVRWKLLFNKLADALAKGKAWLKNVFYVEINSISTT